MKKIIAIIAGEPNSISSEIIFKSWNLKKRMTSQITNHHIDNLYEYGIKYGATGGKLLGAGGGDGIFSVNLK